MPPPDWVSLRLLLAAIELGSVTRAAARCAIATSAAARRLQLLEAAYGAPLLVRGSRGVRPTPAGEVVARHGRTLLNQAARLAHDLRALAAGGFGSARLGATASCLAGHGLAEALADFALFYPGIRVELREDVSPAILGDLLEGRVDLGLVTVAGAPPPGLEERPWRSDRLLAVMRVDHPLAGAAELRFGAVLDQPLVGAMEAGALALLLEEQAQRLDRRPDYRFRVASTDASRRLVAAGHGVAVMPEGVVLPYEAALGLRGVPIAEPWALRRLRLVSAPVALLAAPARLLRDHLAQASAVRSREADADPAS